jgi:hypothetical protein
VQTPVVTVGRFTIDSIDPHGSLGALGVGDGETGDDGELDGTGDDGELDGTGDDGELDGTGDDGELDGTGAV